MYSIGDISKRYNIPISTLRYYDKQGLFPEIQRQSGIRQFSEKEIETLRVIDCLKKSGLEIREIKQFMDWTQLGKETFENRKELFEQQKNRVQEELKEMQKVLDMIKFKCWYYDKAIKLGSEESVQQLIPHQLPPIIKQSYDNAHS